MAEWYKAIYFYCAGTEFSDTCLFNLSTGAVDTEQTHFVNFFKNKFTNGLYNYVEGGRWFVKNGDIIDKTYTYSNPAEGTNWYAMKSTLSQAVTYAMDKSYALPKTSSGTKLVEFCGSNGNSLMEDDDYVAYDTSSVKLGKGEYGKAASYGDIYQRATILKYFRPQASDNNVTQEVFQKLLYQIREKLNLSIPIVAPSDSTSSTTTELTFKYSKITNSWEQVT